MYKQNFLRQGGDATLQIPKSYTIYVYTYKFWQKRDWKLWIYGSQKYILLRKEGLPPCDHQKSYRPFFASLDQKGPEIIYI